MFVRQQNCLLGRDSNAMEGCPNDTSGKEQKRPSSRTSEKYGLRPRSVLKSFHLERGRRRGTSTQRESTKSMKTRPPPLSKYRRKTANARERHRMKEINDAFETLRKILPDFCSRRAAASMTKITTLRLAVSYIRTLSHILEDGHPGDVSIFDSLQVDFTFSGAHFAPMADVQDVSGMQSQSETLEESLGSAVISCSTSTASTYSPSSPTAGSLSSSGDICDLLSDDASVFEDNMDAFDDIPALQEADPFAFLLATDGDVLQLET